MAGADMSVRAPIAERADIQGLLRTAYGGLTEAVYVLADVADRAAARAWLAKAPVTTADHDSANMALQVAISAGGLRALGLSEDIRQGFSAEFLSGMAGDEARSRRLGDSGPNAPAQWNWGYPRTPHLLVALFAAESKLDIWKAEICDHRFRAAFNEVTIRTTTDMHGVEPFGFTDGISQPTLDWKGERVPGTDADLEFGNLISAGEFLLGYPNEYGLYTDRPVIDAAAANAAALPVAADDPEKRDLGRNGSYLVYRELHQDVHAFWQFVAAQPGGATGFAERLVGRRLDGTPLVFSKRRIPGISREAGAQNAFVYEDDREGLACPFGAHIRRANPRTGDMPGGRQSRLLQLIRTVGLNCPDLRQDLVASSRFHRIIRRGREFGERYLPPEQAMAPDAPDPHSGLHFLCLNANISRQFEFVQNAWMASAKFAGLTGEQDPLLGNREPFPEGQTTDGFSIPGANGVARTVGPVPRFVTVKGGGYFFLPGLRALRFLAAE